MNANNLSMLRNLKNVNSSVFVQAKTQNESLDDIDPTLIPELRKLCKGKFNLQTTLDTVNELKFNRQIKNKVDDILAFADTIRATAKMYDIKKS